jgi:hypothetical protein
MGACCAVLLWSSVKKSGTQEIRKNILLFFKFLSSKFNLFCFFVVGFGSGLSGLVGISVFDAYKAVALIK